jgi:hypothetical protein
MRPEYVIAFRERFLKTRIAQENQIRYSFLRINTKKRMVFPALNVHGVVITCYGILECDVPH